MDELEALIDSFIAAGEKTLTISGGEPTLYKRKLINLVKRAQAGGIHLIEVQTNATLIDDDYAMQMRDAGVTSAFVSLLSHKPALHDELAGMDDAFDLCIRGIDALLKYDIRVALNPVTATQTQELVGDYVDFIAERFPEIRSISLSAVQPHGRAARNLDLLPDYGVLTRTLPEAIERAKRQNIELLNPYCGLPLCIGWKDDLEHCVEVFEAESGGFNTPGLQNLGNKSQKEPCSLCFLRTRCGGAWHAYWDIREGSGIEPPRKIHFPWSSDFEHSELDSGLVLSREGTNPFALKSLREKKLPNVWLWCRTLQRNGIRELLNTPCTDIALDTTPSAFLADKESLKAIRQLARDVAGWQPQHRTLIWVGLRAESNVELRLLEKAGSLALALGANGVRLLSQSPAVAGVVYTLSESIPPKNCEQTKSYAHWPLEEELSPTLMAGTTEGF